MTDAQMKTAAREFIRAWTGRGDEKQETQSFWLAFLRDVFGVEKPEEMVKFEVPVKLDHTSFIDGYIDSTRVLIEQKGMDIDLRKGYRQSDGAMMTPFQQARRYAGYLPHDKNPRWIVVCNFKEFHIHDMNRPNDTPEVVLLKDLEKECHRFKFLVDTGSELGKKEMEISLQAGALVGKLYDALLKEYGDDPTDEDLKSLNMLCVRLVFCLYAEDAGIFGSHTMFHDYLTGFQPKNIRKALIDLFKVLNTKDNDRDRFMDEDLAAFPYVNGGLFADDSIVIPRFTDEIIDLLLHNASEDFNWSSISPTIFGAVFESTLNPETRRSGGMHYTSIENIHKVIDPLFLNELTAELDAIAEIGVTKTRNARLEAFQNKLASLTFLDPACGSGNFLTETYLSLRRLENKAVALRMGDQIVLGEAEFDPIKVKIDQFHGIEINDFAVTVAQAALWIAESQMMQETEEIVHAKMDFLPLTSKANIVEGNALRIDWETVVPKEKLNYIMGNPPFVARAGRTAASDSSSKGMLGSDQKIDRLNVFGEDLGNVDYVACWFKKAAVYTQNTTIKVAFVATDSICQGQQIAPIWKSLLSDGIHINFAYRFFKWDSDVEKTATVYVIIVGFSHTNNTQKTIYSNNIAKCVKHISPYLIEADDVLIESRNKPLCNIPKVSMGNQPIDNGEYLFTYEEMTDFLKKEPSSQKHFREWLDAFGFLNNRKKYCLWLGACSPSELRSMPECLKRVKAVRDYRSKSNRTSTKKLSDTPTRFQTENMPIGSYIAIPEVSSGNRKYVPMGFLDEAVLCSNKLRLMPNASLYHFGVLESNVHMAWMRTVCGYFGPSYQYSINIVYNNFPWPTPTEEQKAKIEQTAQAILDARALYPDCSLADLYDEVTMPPELRKAHQQNDKAVMQAYGFWGKLNTETECVAELMKMYQELTKQKTTEGV